MQNTTLQKVTFGAGCFWGVEAAFRQVKGVTSTAVGYSGGNFDNPTYEDVCRGKTGHAEVVEVEYNPAIVSYEELLSVFWNKHNPTTADGQGSDMDSQYRSVIFFHTPEQELLARASKDRLENSSRYNKKPIVTQIAPASQFHKAEEYHQQYLEKHTRASGRIGL
ncbi:peptide-methionine (S)-S-oxide reductase MsrA [Nostoc sp. 106C]|uniref:peptide-methionine (S)-S-oxide reductase MsrA n=1 Tax=Nostoc sp. 106C TaxID=1932667 RepID=UPI000A388F45|nr:peptide-methionine (S)-S-oxide reductase MsrA [Nostoc sp. 106C]OUL36249.1 peptide-methionine (S)-S-oxide reductase [Nostoc sp. 106C]